MSIEFTKRAASEILNRGISAIRIKPDALKDAEKAITKDDVRALIKEGKIYAIKPKKNLSLHGKIRKEKRKKGRSRGPGKKEGKRGARIGRVWEKKIRAQRRFLKLLLEKKIIDNKIYDKYYRLSKGNAFADKKSMIFHLREEDGIKIDDNLIKEINEEIKKRYYGR